MYRTLTVGIACSFPRTSCIMHFRPSLPGFLVLGLRGRVAGFARGRTPALYPGRKMSGTGASVGPYGYRVRKGVVMTDVILFHHAQGLTEGIVEFAEHLRSVGHQVIVPDLFEGRTFASIEDGVGYA